MDNKEQIRKLRDYAELAWASYGYFDLVGKKFDIKDKDKIVTFEDVLDITHKDSKIVDERRIKVGKLDGEFGKEQAKRFFERYKLITHQENTDSGFSATLFEDLGEIDKSTGKRKEVPKDSKYILVFRGTEFKLEQIKDLINDYYIGTNNDELYASLHNINNDGITILNSPKDYMGASVVKRNYEFESSITHPKHFFNCPDVESGNFIKNLKNFNGALFFLESTIQTAQAKLDFDNIKEYDSYNIAQYKNEFKNKCLSERIRAIYRNSWVFGMQINIEYDKDLQEFTNTWYLTLQENHQSVTNFVESFCEKLGYIPPRVNEQNTNESGYNIKYDIITIMRIKQNLSNNIYIKKHLSSVLRQWYIFYKLQYRIFPNALQNYM
ncbi:hypothetical protein [Helicobacter didelphidarum]|uniref:hypothetical protein n=1 Tax=Helicobacter didelphidarum TaxID=2040648 RepID=UPI001FE99F06|nr:hypothetical protein [Helicobacter didelphidarum]